MGLLVVAMALVRWVRLGRWANTLGSVETEPHDLKGEGPGGDPASKAFARRIERAAWRLPFTVKCLPQAVAMQWWLRATRRSGKLVIAAHASDRSGEHAWHAWVEGGGQFLIGDCERAEYCPIVTYVTGPRGV